MPRPPLPEQVVKLLQRPNPSVITSVRPDGQPVSVATWYLLDDGQVLVNMDEGRVVRMLEDEDLADIDRLARHYTGRPYRNRERGRVSAWIEVDRWHGWGAISPAAPSPR